MIDFRKPCESFEQACDEAVEQVSYWGQMKWLRDKYHVQPRFFSRAVPFADRWRGFFNASDAGLSASPAELFAAIPSGTQFCLVHPMTGGQSSVIGAASWSTALVRLREVSPASVAGAVSPMHYERLFETSVLVPVFTKKLGGRLIMSRDYFAKRAGSDRAWLVSAKKRVSAADEHWEKLIFASLLATLENRYDWRVCVGYEDRPSISFRVERESCREIFRLRDVPEGKTRRAALLHFVTNHWKRSRSQAPTEDPSVFVREYLRGQTKFMWNGLTCEVVPPPFDVERLDRRTS